MRQLLLAGAVAAGLCPVPSVAANVGKCHFDTATLSFQGTDSQQAACLLRKVGRLGAVSPAPAVLPASLAGLIGQPATLSKTDIAAYLARSNITETEVGGPLADPLSHARAGDVRAPQARYFVIHDTSAPTLSQADPWPEDRAVDTISSTAAHVFVGRIGTLKAPNSFAVPMRATKLESRVVGTPSKGLFLHIELLQPRKTIRIGRALIDADAPDPGFTPVQYERLALLYTVASARRGNWLVPAFHAAIDEGLSDAHDDPQKFDMAAFAAALVSVQAAIAQHADAAPAAIAVDPMTTGATGADPEAVCRRLVAGLPSLSGGRELVAANSGGETFRQLYADCDRTNLFGGRSLPTYNGRRLKCSTDPNNLAALKTWGDGTVVFTAKASVDADGSPVIGGSGWPNQVQTWLNFDRGSEFIFANAEEIPFIVVPQRTPDRQISFQRDTGIGPGDLAIAIKGDKCSFGVVGDSGPWFRIGEASMRTQADLGNPQCARQDEHPCKRLRGGSGIGIAAGVTYVVFPKTRPRPLLSQTAAEVAAREGAAKAAGFLAANSR
ncbi:chitosanase of glycosyl hydrolase group 75 [Kaistia soli DSM 19436]|uniref:Chitosanase of glycosyl hydrolase group 75 n=1 Tax=Kaistia soli DSM 19436 TaxID=1122133 RepID=A0A1M5IL12_9HYPH|nr:glycoside hydrolase family 75 protein [Kaistia soli]SHG29044.1 chitosanase of glycosyl hydrolase group 75 [Kaistia soli DSM 19436]